MASEARAAAAAREQQHLPQLTMPRIVSSSWQIAAGQAKATCALPLRVGEAGCPRRVLVAAMAALSLSCASDNDVHQSAACFAVAAVAAMLQVLLVCSSLNLPH